MDSFVQGQGNTGRILMVLEEGDSYQQFSAIKISTIDARNPTFVEIITRKAWCPN